MTGLLCYWLIPAAPDLQSCSRIIIQLAGRFQGPLFDPHMTLAVVGAGGPPPGVAGEPPPGALERLRWDGGPLRLRVRRIAFSESVWRACYWELEAEEGLLLLRRQVSRVTSGRAVFPEPPHVSLFYGLLPEQARQLLSRQLAAPATLRFDTLRAVWIPELSEDPFSAAGWRCLASWPLAG